MLSNSSKKIGGQIISKIWEWIIKGDPVPNSKGYYSVTCSFCEFHWTTAKVAKLKRHLAYNCNKIDSETKINVLMMLTSNNEDLEDDSTTTSTTKSSKKQKSSDTRSQTCIDDHYENFPTSLVKEDQINKALAKMFVCCNLPFSLIEHPFFIEFIKILRTTYNFPSRWVLTETLIIQEVSRITLKVNRIIEEENNLTIAFDGWTNSTGQSIYDYCLITEERKEYLWCSKNYSDVSHHTGAFLGNEIIKIVDDIDPEKVAAVVTDNAPDARVAQRILCKKYPHILNIRYMTHCINLIMKDVCKHTFVADTVRKVEHGNDIKNWVKDILYDQNFYKNCRIITFILHPLKVKVGCLESRTSSLADCYIHLLSLASAVYHMLNQNIEFKNHCVIKFNEQYDEFSDDLFLLAFFLHSRYHGNGINPSKIHNITVKATQIWKNMGHDQESCGKLLSQMRKYMKNKAPFNQHYNYKSDTPIICASCERSFSVLGWFYGQRRTKLAVDQVEGMCKLYTYYITNTKRKLPYYAIDTSESSLHEKMIATLTEISDELVGKGDYDFLYKENIIDTIIDMSKTYNLNVALDIDIDSHIFNMEDEVIVSQRRQTVVLDPEHEDYNIEVLIAKEMNDDNGS
ncbi:hypothetical protein RclHR1_20590003 [Rhizophagus clarus]|uniref:DUF659 domain-containing protein n=1 Tax=Rhizophagus clarus TaxID=94130 RepID=A0A2Z6RKE4_9GLOM|nr:hypothetical protein RclHR1_20590003 [Rhizophagus clarus]